MKSFPLMIWILISTWLIAGGFVIGYLEIVPVFIVGVCGLLIGIPAFMAAWTKYSEVDYDTEK